MPLAMRCSSSKPKKLEPEKDSKSLKILGRYIAMSYKLLSDY
jgi:hypothetical protein